MQITASSAPLKQNRRRPLYAALSGVLIAGGLSAYFITHAQANSTESAPQPPAPKVTVASVEERTLVEYDEFTGRVDAIETVEVRPRVSGHIQEVRFQAGQLVQKGDVLFVIDPRWHQAQFDLATAEVERAQAKLDTAQREAKRADELLAKQAIAVEEADARRSRYAEAKAAVLSAQATLATARLDLEYTEIRAPIAGRVSRAFITAGNHISGTPGLNTVLTTIVSVGEVYVYVDADEAQPCGADDLSECRRPAHPGTFRPGPCARERAAADLAHQRTRDRHGSESEVRVDGGVR